MGDTLTATIDARCKDHRCSEPDIYRMVGRCYNCGTQGLLMLYTRGHKAEAQDCPVCGYWRAVHIERLATDDEFPAAVEGRDA